MWLQKYIHPVLRASGFYVITRDIEQVLSEMRTRLAGFLQQSVPHMSGLPMISEVGARPVSDFAGEVRA